MKTVYAQVVNITLIIAILGTSLLLNSCEKSDSSQEISLTKYRAKVNQYSNDELLELANLTKGIISGAHSKNQVLLTPEELLFSVETELNRVNGSGKLTRDDLVSNLYYFPYTTDGNGKLDGEFLSYLYNEIVVGIEDLEGLGKEIYMIDIEIAEGQNIFVVDVITVNCFYLGEGFGFMYFNENQSYHVFWDDFAQEVNNRLIFEYIDLSEFFVTDITPNPSIDPIGAKIWAADIIGDLGIGECLMYKGTEEVFGGPELVYGNNQENMTLSGVVVNQFMDKALNYFNSDIPEGFQLIKLRFYISENPYAADFDCLPGDACNTYYPCNAFSHKWQQGRIGRVVALNK